MNAVYIYILVAIFTPGPNNVMSSASSSRIGFLKTLPFMAGVLVGTFLVFCLTSIFYVALYDKIPIIKTYIGFIGAAYICFLAFKIAITDNLKETKNIKSKNLFFKAIFLTFVNPKVIIFGLTVTGLFYRWGINIEQLLKVSSALASLCFLSVIIWGGFGYLFMRVLAQYQKVFNTIMASLLIFSALLIIIDTV